MKKERSTGQARPMSVIWVSMMIGVLTFVASAPAYAYIDPGTGSILVQSLLAGVAVALGVLRNYWHRIRLWLSPNRPDTAADDPVQHAGAEEAEATSER